MRRRGILIALGVIAFLAVSFQLARFLTAENAERAAVYALLEDEARGDARAVTRRLDGCDGGCARGVEATVSRIRRPGEVKILRLDSAANFTLGERTARSRVAWAADATSGGEAIVQCVTVRRRWSFVSGASVTLLRLSAPLPPEKSC
ncbi:MAG: hypothetical protein M3417_05890 [Actinomycetota bacterium]|nr:hypothetical protein [Actinomycetota bacterium]